MHSVFKQIFIIIYVFNIVIGKVFPPFIDYRTGDSSKITLDFNFTSNVNIYWLFGQHLYNLMKSDTTALPLSLLDIL